MAWKPKTICRFLHALPTSASTAIVETDCGTAYLKAMGGNESPHSLACELIGTSLAKWLGLQTLDFTLIEVTNEDEIPLCNEQNELIANASPGPAFVTRGEVGDVWGGNDRQLKQLANPEDISRLVVFDTWTLNCDRHGPPEGTQSQKPRINLRNVFLSAEAPPGQLILKAIDHNCCFTCGKTLTAARLREVSRIKDKRVFGLFPRFRKRLKRPVVHAATARLAGIDKQVVASMMQEIPRQWDVRKEVQEAWTELIVGRARFVAATIEMRIWPQRNFDPKSVDEEEEP